MIGRSIGKYRVIDRIGRGGMGTVYRATDDMLRRDVAIKILHAELNDPEVAKRFRTEAITVARLSHPGIATVYELFEHDGQWLMVMEFLRGITLEALVEKSGVLSPQRAAELCLHVLAALAHAHNLGIVHRDLKPANLMLTESGAVKIMDFGIARVSGTDHLTTAGYMMGTPAYMAPEQVLGRAIDERADLYAMGVVLYRLVTGSLPFRGDSAFALAQSQVNDPPMPAGLLRTDLPAWVDQIISRALAKNPSERFQTATAFHDMLAQCIVGRATTLPVEPGIDSEVFVTPPYPTPLGSSGPITAIVPAAQSGDTAPMGAFARLASANAGAATPAAADSARHAAAFTRSNRLVLSAAAAIVVLTIGLAALWIRFGGPVAAPPDVPVSAPLAVSTLPVPVTSTPAPSPADSKAAAVSGHAVSTPRASAPSVTAVVPVAERSAPTRSAVAPSEFHMIPGLKWISFGTDWKAKESEVALTLAAGHVSISPKEGGKPLQSMSLASIKKATFVHADNPEFDATLAGPPTTDYPNRLAKNWLVLQNESSFMIIRLENATGRVLAAFDAAGTKIIRPVPTK